MPYLTHVKVFSVSWIQENQDLQNGRILLVLESVGGVQIAQRTGYRVSRAQEEVQETDWKVESHLVLCR